ncbi:uncharacterized protein [Nicotiana sylvestris]|uniref:uncharacterized protein n=1 Tax=Nicotiana sylvestris TaxID=4096 RepID=UPI00388CD107
MKAICETFKIKHNNSTAYRPQMNGALEAANKNIKKILRKMLENHKQWHEKLPFALLGYRTIVRKSTGANPYLLVYGIEAVISAEVEIPSLRIIQEDELSDVEWIRSRYEQLDLIDGKEWTQYVTVSFIRIECPELSTRGSSLDSLHLDSWC